MEERVSVFMPGSIMSSCESVSRIVRQAAGDGVEPVVEIAGQRVGMWTAFPDTQPTAGDAVFCVKCGRWFPEAECKSFTIRQAWGSVDGTQCPNWHDAESFGRITPGIIRQKSGRVTGAKIDHVHWTDTSEEVWGGEQ